jgi:hypothetical protein
MDEPAVRLWTSKAFLILPWQRFNDVGADVRDSQIDRAEPGKVAARNVEKRRHTVALEKRRQRRPQSGGGIELGPQSRPR